MAQHLYVPGTPSFGHGAKYTALLGIVSRATPPAGYAIKLDGSGNMVLDGSGNTVIVRIV